MYLNKEKLGEGFELFYPIGTFFLLLFSYVYSLWKFNFNVYKLSNQEYVMFFRIFFEKASLLLLIYNIAYIILKGKSSQAFLWGITFISFLIIDKFFSFYLQVLDYRFEIYHKIGIPNKIQFLFTFFFLSFMNIVKPQKIDLAILPLAISFLMGITLTKEPVVNSDVKFILITPFLVAILFSGGKPYGELSIILTSSFLFISVKGIVTFSGIFAIFLKGLRYISTILSTFLSAFISFITFASGYFSFLIFQKGIPFNEPFEFVSQIHFSSVGIITAFLILFCLVAIMKKFSSFIPKINNILNKS
jgi:hypothetical protein